MQPDPEPHRLVLGDRHSGRHRRRAQDAGKDATERLEDVDFQLAWPSISRSFGANGHFVWHDQPVEASLTLSDFLAALTGERSGVKLRLPARR